MTIKVSSPAPFVPLPSAASDKSGNAMRDVWLAIGVTGFVLFCLFAIAAGHSDVACALVSLIWAIVLTVWICKIKNRQTETVDLLEKILAEIKKQNC
jgi:hypothetical protein